MTNLTPAERKVKKEADQKARDIQAEKQKKVDLDKNYWTDSNKKVEELQKKGYKVIAQYPIDDGQGKMKMVWVFDVLKEPGKGKEPVKKEGEK